MTGLNIRILLFLVLVFLLLAQEVSALAQSDEFNSGSLNTGLWHWVRENTSAWIAGSTYIQINSTATDMDPNNPTIYAPLLLQNTTNINQTIYTKITSVPDANYEGGGLLFYANDDNYINVVYYNASSTAKVLIKKEDNNVSSYSSNITTATSPIYLRINKSGTTYTGYYSSNGSVWTQIGVSYTITDVMTDVGITAYGVPSTDPEPFQFDYFRVEPVESTYIPPTPLVLQQTNGRYWVNYTWSTGFGNVTNSFNVSQNNTWTNGSSLTYMNNTVGILGWSNISIYAFNSSGTGTLNTTGTSMNTQAPAPFLESPSLTNTTGANWIRWAWNALSGADSYEVYIVKNT